MSRIEFAIDQISGSRFYTSSLISDADDSDWFRQPFPDANHIAWQVGHIIVAEYGLTLEALRGRRREDSEWFPKPYRRLFGRTSKPESDAEAYPSPAELKQVLGRVHEHVVAELRTVEDGLLDEPPEWNHPLCPTKLEALHFCARHEMVHAGQIGMLRRMLGKEWLR